MFLDSRWKLFTIDMIPVCNRKSKRAHLSKNISGLPWTIYMKHFFWGKKEIRAELQTVVFVNKAVSGMKKTPVFCYFCYVSQVFQHKGSINQNLEYSLLVTCICLSKHMHILSAIEALESSKAKLSHSACVPSDQT